MLSSSSSTDNSNRLLKDRERFPISVEADNPFMASQEFELLPGKEKSLVASVQAHVTSPKIDEIVQKINRQLIKASETRLGRIPDNIALIDNLGISYLNSGDFENAIKCFKKSLTVDPNSFQTLANLAKAYLSTGDTGEALKIYLCIEKSDPENIQVLNNIANILIRIKEYGRAKDYLENALKKDPKNLASLSNSAMIMLLENHTNKAINFYRRALSVKSDSPGVLNNIGVCFATQKNFKKAMKHFLAAHSLKKTDLGILLNLAHCYFEKGDIDESFRTLESYLKNGQDSIQVRETLAWMNYLRKDYKNSLNHLTAAMKLFESGAKGREDKGRVLSNIAVVYQSLGDYEAAKKYYALSLDVNPLTTSLILPLCNAINFYFIWGKDESAKKLIDRGFTDFPQNLRIRESLGRYYFEKQDYKQACEILSEVISLDPKAVLDAYAVLSVIEMEINKNMGKAREILVKGLTHHPDNDALLNNLAYNYLIQDDTERARIILDSIQGRDETFIATATRGLLLIKEGNIQEGQRLYNLAKSISIRRFSQFTNLIEQKKDLEVAKYYEKKGDFKEAARLLRKVLSVKAKHDYYSNEAKQIMIRFQNDELA